MTLEGQSGLNQYMYKAEQIKVCGKNVRCKGSFTQAIFLAQFNVMFVELELQLENRECKPAAILGNLSPWFEIELAKHGNFE